ncbi:hypothetical protein F5144DRAFT_550833 [Chaetomium tenue]|uniref:Uncharacterized protein n=1 Tax=Chaetomium tenue TaxID=1854479 RepID=A0ACB7P025_9PEZI|nr:hypothetical protein F5144DRAFT_550833 [Chaetomium globosum]
MALCRLLLSSSLPLIPAKAQIDLGTTQSKCAESRGRMPPPAIPMSHAGPLPHPASQNRGVTALMSSLPQRHPAPSAHYQPDTGHKIMYALNKASTPPHFNQEKPLKTDGRTFSPLPIRKSLTRVLTASITCVLHACK